jgi:signal transduction histidine kinase
MLSGIAQLKTPLTAIRSFSEILRDNPDLPDDERQRFLSIVLDETERLHQHIERMLES